MARHDCETVYLKQKDAVLLNADNTLGLSEILEGNPQIKTVVLFYVWTEDYYTSNASIFEAYVSPATIDEEYSFFGNREEAIEFADSYEGVWDSCEFLLFNGNILYGYQDNHDYQRSFNDGYDHINGLGEGYDPTWFTWLRVDFDYENGIEYLLSPDPIDTKRASE